MKRDFWVLLAFSFRVLEQKLSILPKTKQRSRLKIKIWSCLKIVADFFVSKSAVFDQNYGKMCGKCNIFDGK